jgi:hypothetical protein
MVKFDWWTGNFYFQNASLNYLRPLLFTQLLAVLHKNELIFLQFRTIFDSIDLLK